MSESIASEVVSAMVGGIFSASALYPLEVLKTRMQAETKSSSSTSTTTTTTTTLSKTKKEEEDEEENDDDSNNNEEKTNKREINLQKQQQYMEAASKGMISYASLMYEKEGGIKPFYSGVFTSAIQSATEKALYFFAYTFYKNGYVGITGTSDFGTLPNLILGCMAEWSHLPITLPIDCLTTAIQTDTHNRGALALLCNILSTKGIGGFYKGIEAYTILCLKPAIQYTVYEQVKRIVLAARRVKRLANLSSSSSSSGGVGVGGGRDRIHGNGDNVHDGEGRRSNDHSSLSAAEAFFLGMFARVVATMLTYPYLRAKVMLQSNNNNNNDTGDGGKKKTIPQMIAEQLSSGGVSGLYQGIGPELTRGVFSAALMMMAKERIGVVVKAMIDG